MTVDQKSRFQTIIVERAECIFIVHLHPPGGQVDRLHPHRLIHALHLVGMWIPGAVGGNQAVVAEVLVALAVIVVPVAGVAIERLPVAADEQRLVHKVPDETALILGIATHQVPIFAKSSLGIAHGVGILALDERARVVAPGIAFAILIAQIHRAIDVGKLIQPGTLVHHRTRRVFLLRPTIASLEIGAESGFVSHRPDDDGRMVEVTLHVALVALQMGLQVIVAPRQRLFPVAHAVRLDVGLGHHVQSVAVAQLIPVRVVRIVAGAHCIDVHLLHDAYVLKHPLARHDITRIRVHLVTVHALDQNRMAVDAELPVLDFHATEAHPHGNDLHGTPLLHVISQKGVQVRRLGRPLAGSRHLHPGRPISATPRQCRFGHLPAVGIEQTQHHRASALHADSHVQPTVAIGVVKLRRDADIGNVFPFAGIQIAVAPHAGQAEKVLIFQIGAVAPTIDLKSDEIILAGIEIGRHVKLSLQLAVLAVTHKAAVHPQVNVRRDRAQVDKHLLALPVGGHTHRAPVRAYMILLRGHPGRTILEMLAPGIACIDIDRVAIAVEFPHSGHRHRAPRRVVIVRAEKVAQGVVGILLPMKMPHTVQRKIIGLRSRIAGQCRFFRSISKIIGVHRRTVDFVHFGVLPLGKGLPRHRHKAGQKQPAQIHTFFHGCIRLLLHYEPDKRLIGTNRPKDSCRALR